MELTDAFFQKAAGWQAVQHARALLAAGQVLSSNWSPPLLRGVVRAGDLSHRSGLVIKGPIDIENVCTCRQSREFGTLCAHSVAVGLHHIASTRNPPAPASSNRGGRPPSQAGNSHTPAPAATPRPGLRRVPPGEAGSPLALHVLFPPNLPDAITRGKVLLVVEGANVGQRAPLPTFARTGPHQLDDSDARLLDALEALTGGAPPGMLQVSLTDFLRLLPALADHPRLTMGRNASLAVLSEPFAPPVRARLLDDGQIQLDWPHPPHRQPQTHRLGGDGSHWLLQADSGGWRLQPIAVPPLLGALWDGPMIVPRLQVPLFLHQVWPALAASAPIDADFAPSDFSLDPAPPRFTLELTGGMARLTALLLAAYGPRILTLGASRPDESAVLPDPAHPRRYTTRDARAEQEAVQRLRRAGFQGPDPRGHWTLAGQDAVLRFFTRDMARLQREWTVSFDERLDQGTRQRFEAVRPRFEVIASGEQWFELEIAHVSANGEVLSQADIQQLLRGGSRRLRSGRLPLLDAGALDEVDEVLRDCAPRQVTGDGSTRYRLDRQHAAYLEASLREQGLDLRILPGSRTPNLPLTGTIQPVCPPLGDLDPILRPYQKQGVAWLSFLREHGFGGLLADEMGLGKTLQILALLQAHRRPGHPHLVICPTSLVFNWQSEAARFTPQLRTLALHGPDRHRLLERIPDHDLILTSYALVRRDMDHYRDIGFDTVVLDEAQHIKNRATRNAQAVKSLDARHRLVLTGTPLENSVLDLWSLFDFLQPGYLGSAADFKERYEVPIARERDPATMARLGRRIRPFVLRRTKKEVLADLPPKLEQVAWCDLSERQSALYQQLLDATRKEVLGASGEPGTPRSRLLVLTALLRLRQVCCDPRLLEQPGSDTSPGAETLPSTPLPAPGLPETAHPVDGAAAATEPGGKIQLFAELLDEILDGGHRVLVFSQFTRMLHLIRGELERRDVRFCYLDGQTRDRAAVVGSYQSDPAIPVFLISLKAGGTGLNLTGADTVIHFDPWWNPAVEDQATDRAHRIGQSRAVTSYKLIARNTVEEKILRLQQRKREVIAATLTGEEAFTGSLSWEEIQELLA